MASSRRFDIGCGWVMWTVILGVACMFVDQRYFNMWQQWKQESLKCVYNPQEALARVHNLSTNLQKQVFGQHLALKIVTNALYAHHKTDKPHKALVMSFHGPQGTGKTLVSQLIAEHMFQDGLDNPHVQFFIGPKHFLLDPDKLVENQAYLISRLETARKTCSRALFIFDEIDKMPGEILDALVPYVDHHRSIDGTDYRGLTLIFLTNTGGPLIKKATIALMVNDRVKREDISLEHFSESIAKNAFTEKGGLCKSDMIWKSLIDYYVPFLPLEKEHIEACAKRDIVESNTLFITPEKVAAKVDYTTYNQLEWNTQHGTRKFANDGCKAVRALVNFYAEEYYALQGNPGTG